MKVRAALLAMSLLLAQGHPKAQETQAEPQPTSPAPGSQKPAAKAAQQLPAPVERRASKPTVDVEPESGPMTPHKGPSGSAQQPSGDQPAATIRVRTRLVNVALNVVDAHGTPVGGFEKKDFQILENGKAQPIAVFEREASSPLSIVLAIDSSETVLTSERLEREAAKHFIRAILRQQDELDLMDFADNVREIVPFTNNARQVELGLGRLQQGEETALYNAVYLASERLAGTSQEANRRRVLVIISDGGDSIHGGEKYEDAVEQAQRANAIIYSIIIVPVAADAGRNTGGEHALIQMSEDTGGKYYYVEDPSDLEPAFRHVSEDLRTQYLLGYYSPESSKELGEAAFRRIRVKLTDPAAAEKYSLRYRTGYFADE
ncbi:MAG TPA: VWA domain-containing protein [Acidobacteriaceae bacterium]|jgi:Ca-activated chloride channel family protein|nr:VWA domain-containing protein [Acidobacteriaceae bacterium]